MSAKTLAKTPQLIILLLLVSFASVGAVLFTPALPTITAFFQVSIDEVQLTITSYLLGYAFGQLPYGPLANRFGRKKTLYIGLSLAIFGSLLCVVSAWVISFKLLVFARFLQAFGGCVGLKVSFTMVADVYSQKVATKIIARILMAFAVMPGVATMIGGGLTQFISWQSCFYFLAIFGGFILWLSTRLPETAKSLDPNALNISEIYHGYMTAFKNQRLIISGLIMGCGTAIVYVFASKAPFIGINLIGMTPSAFGAFNLLPLVGMLLGSLLAAKLSEKFSLLKLLFAGILSSLFATLTMLIPFASGLLNPISLFFPMFLIYFTEALVFANISSFGLANAKNKSNGSAVLNFVNLSATVIATLLAEFIYPESAVFMPINFIVFFCIMLLLWFRLKKLEESNAA